MSSLQGKKISLVSEIFMPMVALFFDILSFIPLAGIVASPMAWIVFTLWLYMEGIPILSVRRLATMAVSVVVGLIPFLNYLPEITLSILAIIIMVRLENQVGIKLPTLK